MSGPTRLHLSPKSQRVQGNRYGRTWDRTRDLPRVNLARRLPLVAASNQSRLWVPKSTTFGAIRSPPDAIATSHESRTAICGASCEGDARPPEQPLRPRLLAEQQDVSRASWLIALSVFSLNVSRSRIRRRRIPE